MASVGPITSPVKTSQVKRSISRVSKSVVRLVDGLDIPTPPNVLHIGIIPSAGRCCRGSGRRRGHRRFLEHPHVEGDRPGGCGRVREGEEVAATIAASA